MLTITIFDRLKPSRGYRLPWELIYSSWSVAGKEFVVWQWLYHVSVIPSHLKIMSKMKILKILPVMQGLSPFHFETWLLPTRSYQPDVCLCGELPFCENKIKNPGNLCFALEWKCYLLDSNCIYTVTISLFFCVCKLYVTYSLHKKLKFLLLESLQFGTKSV